MGARSLQILLLVSVIRHKYRFVLGESRWLAVFPGELSPQKEGESLEIRFNVRGADVHSEIDEIKLEFRAFSICHYFNIFTDIT